MSERPPVVPSPIPRVAGVGTRHGRPAPPHPADGPRRPAAFEGALWHGRERPGGPAHAGRPAPGPGVPDGFGPADAERVLRALEDAGAQLERTRRTLGALVQALTGVPVHERPAAPLPTLAHVAALDARREEQSREDADRELATERARAEAAEATAVADRMTPPALTAHVLGRRTAPPGPVGAVEARTAPGAGRTTPGPRSGRPAVVESRAPGPEESREAVPRAA